MKRTTCNGSSPPTDAKKPKIVRGKKKQLSTIVSSRYMTTSVKIEILAKSLLETSLSTEQLTAMQIDVLNQIVMQTASGGRDKL